MHHLSAAAAIAPAQFFIAAMIDRQRVTLSWVFQHSTAQHSTAQHSTAHHGTAQHSTAQHSTAQHSTAQRSAPQAGRGMA